MITGKENVLRLDVSMHDALLVRVLECVGDVAENPDGVGDRQLARSLQSGAERLPFDARHRIIEEVVLRAGEK